MNPERKELPIRSHTIVNRFVYGEGSTNSTRVDRYDLVLGSVLIFTGTKETPNRVVPPRKGEQDTIKQMLEVIVSNHELVQVAVILDQNTGGLLVTDGTPEKSWGIDLTTLPEDRCFSLGCGNQSFTFIWGESKQETEAVLQRLQDEAIRRN
ncbi:MAG: hypothetical protein ABH867_03605 [Patescibacteria group bacterium]|nr:hypothetical protein [Patescibacteria group bacterium]